MKTCILTVIKNEQEYLDEWIQYHLHLGIDHLFIFEDLGSDSHKNITDKYTDKVSLSNISSILDQSLLTKVLKLKKTKADNPQQIYFKVGLMYIKNNFSYDWCFVIDIDEFITPENPQLRLSTIFQIYSKYDAFVMSWECYGANGLVNKPNYSENFGVLQNYPDKCKGFINNPARFHMKSCYNLHTFEQTFCRDVHQPSDQCKWCRTDYSVDREKEIYNIIYIRHYITKSWEEYMDKKYTRGFFVGISRTDDFFFNVNPDMRHLKDSLLKNKDDCVHIPESADEVLVVLPYVENQRQGTELNLALTGWRKFCQFNYHFIVIGEFNPQLREKYPWVQFIYQERKPKKDNQYNPHLDIQHKMNVIYNQYANLYNGFIWMVDDNYAIKPFTLNDITTIHYHASSFTGQESAPTNYWNHDKWKTRQLLDAENLSHVNYTTHYPCYFDFKRLKNIWDKYDMQNNSYVIEDIYFNSYEHDQPILDNTLRLGVWSYNIYKNEFEKAVNDPNIKFVCNSVEGWSRDFEESLKRIIHDE